MSQKVNKRLRRLRHEKHLALVDRAALKNALERAKSPELVKKVLTGARLADAAKRAATMIFVLALFLAIGCGSVQSNVTRSASEAKTSLQKIRASTVPAPKQPGESDVDFSARVQALTKLEDDTERLLGAISEAPAHD